MIVLSPGLEATDEFSRRLANQPKVCPEFLRKGRGDACILLARQTPLSKFNHVTECPGGWRHLTAKVAIFMALCKKCYFVAIATSNYP